MDRIYVSSQTIFPGEIQIFGDEPLKLKKGEGGEGGGGRGGEKGGVEVLEGYISRLLGMGGEFEVENLEGKEGRGWWEAGG